MTDLQKKLRYASIALGVALVAMLASEFATRSLGDKALEPQRPTNDQTSAKSAEISVSKDQTHVAKQEDRRLIVGLIGSKPKRDQILKLETIPWSSTEIRDAYRSAEGRMVQMLPADVPVSMPLADAGHQSSVSGVGVPALTIRLDTDDRAKNALPKATKDSIVRYLKEHEIAIQPMVYVDESGRLYFGGTCRAALYRVGSPNLTEQPEPLVQESINRIRVLGVLANSESKDARTLVLAIRYARTDDQTSTGITGAKYENELLFLHILPESTASNPMISAFITSQGRELLHRLGRADLGHSVKAALITTKIRFDSFVMMGMYPASPVVTGVIPYQSVQLPVEVLLRGSKITGNGKPVSFQAVLDNFAVSDEASSWHNSSYSGSGVVQHLAWARYNRIEIENRLSRLSFVP